MGMKSVEVTLQGVTPLLMHQYPLVPVEALDKKTPEEQAEVAAYRDPETKELYIPGVAIWRTLVNGAAFSKGKGRATLSKIVAACVAVSPERVSLNVKHYKIDSRAVVMPATKGRIIRHRPRLDEWKCTFTVDWDDTLLTETQVRKVVDDSIRLVGFLDFRPEKKGPYGRSMIVEWKSV